MRAAKASLAPGLTRELSLELGHLFRAGAERHRHLSRYAAVGPRADAADRDLRVAAGAAVRLDHRRAAHAAVEDRGPDRLCLRRILPQHAAAGAAVFVVLRAAGNPAAILGDVDEADV